MQYYINFADGALGVAENIFVYNLLLHVLYSATSLAIKSAITLRYYIGDLNVKMKWHQILHMDISE